MVGDAREGSTVTSGKHMLRLSVVKVAHWPFTLMLWTWPSAPLVTATHAEPASAWHSGGVLAACAGPVVTASAATAAPPGVIALMS